MTSYPYLYSGVSGNNVLTASAHWTLTNSVSSPPWVAGFGPAGSGINIPPTQTTADSGGGGVKFTLPPTAATSAFPNQVSCYENPLFKIDWLISFDGGSTWQSTGSSNNPIYVCISDTGPNSVTLFRTVVHLACSNTGATTPNAAVLNTWALFFGPSNVNAWNESAQSYGRPLYYYKPGTSFTDNPAGSAAALLQSSNSSGQCSTWAELLCDSLKLNGTTASYIKAEPIGADAFLVNNWTFGTPTSGYPNVWIFDFPTTNFDMTPVPTGGVYGDLTNQNTLLGQNSTPLAPSQKVFGNHQFLKYTGPHGDVTYLDPSYGKAYQNEADFQAKAIAGFGTDNGIHGAKLQYLVTKPDPANNQIKFTDLGSC